jgi:hypothetical protein
VAPLPSNNSNLLPLQFGEEFRRVHDDGVLDFCAGKILAASASRLSRSHSRLSPK